jgi:hypothetical protein
MLCASRVVALSKSKKYLIHREFTPETEDLWELVFDPKTGSWSVDHYWTYQETRSRGTRRRSIPDFEQTAAGKRLTDQLQEALGRASNDV